MSTYKAVFSDIDGTLLTSEHIVSTATIEAIASLQDKNIPFVIISSRSASCIYLILEKHHFQCPIVACGGAWIEDMNGRILSNEGMSKQTAATVIEFMTEKNSISHGASIPERTGLQMTERTLVFSMKKVLWKWKA